MLEYNRNISAQFWGQKDRASSSFKLGVNFKKIDVIDVDSLDVV